MEIMMKRFFSLTLLISSVLVAEPDVREIIKRYIPADPIILEAGAHNGSDTAKTAIVWPNATIYAFEPVPRLFNELRNNTLKFHSVHCYQVALSDKTGRAKFYLSSGSSDMSSSLLKPKEHLKYHPEVFFTRIIEVDTINLDEWAGIHNIAKIDFMWLNMQGSELAMLKASPEILKTVTAIYTEVNFYEAYAGCPTYPEMRSWFQEQGFEVVYEDIHRWVSFGDVLFIRKNKGAVLDGE